MIKDWNFWFSVITAMAAMIALILTVMQMRLSNKQNLFDRRLDCYLKTNGLIKLYSENRALLEQNREDQPMFAVDFEF